MYICRIATMTVHQARFSSQVAISQLSRSQFVRNSLKFLLMMSFDGHKILIINLINLDIVDRHQCVLHDSACGPHEDIST